MMPNTNTTDWGAIATWIALAVAIISPIITTIISNKHQTKLKHLQIIENHGLNVIDNYITLSAEAIINKNISNEYEISYAKIFLYAPKRIHPDIIKLNNEIYSLSLSAHSSSYNKPTNDGLLHINPFAFIRVSDENECKDLLIKICKKLNYNNL